MEDKRFVFVGGLHRSGTTLLARCLAGHPDISGFAGTGVKEDEGQHLQTVYPAANTFGGSGGFGFSPQAHVTEASPLVSDANRRRLWEQWSPHWDLSRSLLVEKSPPNLMKSRFLQALFPNSWFVMLIRHPIAVAHATEKWTRRTKAGLIRHWLVCHETMMEDVPHLRRVRLLHYEDLVARPDQVLSEIYTFLGVEPHPGDVTVRSGINDKYFDRWEARRGNPLRRPALDRAAARYESRVNRFGYSLLEPRAPVGPLPATSTPSAGSIHSGG
ncbi:MAG: sulfotransferase family protein [Gaiellales bacterium]